MHEAITAQYPVDADLPNEYDEYPTWMDATSPVLIPDHARIVEGAKKDLRKQFRRRYGDRASAARRLRTPGRLVAALPFSFWVFLFDEAYSGSRENPGVLWPTLLVKAFPHNSGPPLKLIRKRLRHLLIVRNRVMHHERIYPYDDGRGLPWNPQQIRREVLELLSWMSPRAATLAGRFDRVQDVMHPLNLRYLRWAPHLF